MIASADLVAHMGQELALGRVRRLGGRAGLLELELEALTLADVAGHARELQQTALVIQHRGHDDLGPEGRAILVVILQLAPEPLRWSSSLERRMQATEIVQDDGC